MHVMAGICRRGPTPGFSPWSRRPEASTEVAGCWREAARSGSFHYAHFPRSQWSALSEAARRSVAAASIGTAN